MNRSSPHFLGIGAQKAGTTWLWANLREHPDIWMPPIKELHYFTRSPSYPSPNWLASEGLKARFFGQQPRDLFMRRWLISRLKKHLPFPDFSLLRWEWRFFFRQYDDEWYTSLFKPGAGKVTGEITPAYSILKAEDVAQIKVLLPKVKIIFLLRNPIDRAWSQIRFDKAHEEPLANVVAFINGAHQSLRGDYLRTIKNWRSSFDDDQFFIGFYEDIQRDPQELLSQVSGFLLLRQIQLDPDQLNSRVHTSATREIPPEVELFLTQKYLPQLEELSAMLGHHATTWFEEAKTRVAILSKRTDLSLTALQEEAGSDQRWSDWASHRWQRRGLPRW